MKGIISVIVPVYNVEHYLSKCLDSIVNQTYQNLEIILIDDGSTDQSGSICDEYAKKDNRIVVIHQKNGGAANAKNTGLKVATGQYLAFVDSDDYLELDAYGYMINQLELHNADMIQCSFRDFYVDCMEDRIMLDKYTIFNTEEYLKRYLIDWTSGLLWDKLYRGELFKGVFFEENHKIDDEFFTYQGVINAKKILHSPKIIYNYRKRKSGVMMSEESQKQIILDKLDYLDKRRKKVSNAFRQLKKAFDYHYLNMLVILSKDIYATEKSILITKQKLKEYQSEKDQCKIEFTLWYELIKIRFGKIQKILDLKQQGIVMKDLNKYYD